MKYINLKKYLQKLTLLVIKYVLIFLFSFGLSITIATVVEGQIGSLSSANAQVQRTYTPVWQMYKIRRCGKLWCTNVNFPYFPYDIFYDNFTITSRANLEDPNLAAAELETRVDLIETTLLSIYKKILRNFQNNSDQSWQNQVKKLNIRAEDWWLFTNKPLHPLTPKIEVGIKNEQTVIFVPEQLDLGLSNETILTVTKDDSIYNGQPIDELAKQWRNIIQEDLNHALWGYQFDLNFPWGRLAIIAGILILTILPIILITILRALIRSLDRKLRQKIKELEESALSEIASKYNQSNSLERVTEKEDQNIITTSKKKVNKFLTKLPKPIKKPLHKFNLFFHNIQDFILAKIQNLTKGLSTVSLQYQNIIKQLRNLTLLLIQFLFWLRFLILFVGLGLIVTIYPSTRVTAFFFLAQAIFLPIIWMFVNLGHTITSFIIDFYLDRWAKEAQLSDPNSTRYALRVTTYSPAFKGASNFLFILVGIYLTIELLGIDTSILASAGFAALAIGFLGRNVLEDMLNGILILWTDRYAIGDIVDVGGVGGLVEDMNLYTTQIRGSEGCLITVPNGQIKMVQNKTKDWSRVEFKIEIAANSNPLKAIKILEEVGEEMQQDPDWQEFILEPVNILGIDQLSHQGILIQVWIKTQPMKQWVVGRQFRLRVQQAFKAQGIELGIPQRQILYGHEEKE